MKTLNNIEVTNSQHKSISNYAASGIDIELIDNETVKIKQSRLINGYILNNKQLHERAREVFPDHKIIQLFILWT